MNWVYLWSALHSRMTEGAVEMFSLLLSSGMAMQCPWISARAVTLISELCLSWNWKVLLACTCRSVCAQLLGAVSRQPASTDSIELKGCCTWGRFKCTLTAENPLEFSSCLNSDFRRGRCCPSPPKTQPNPFCLCSSDTKLLKNHSVHL